MTPEELADVVSRLRRVGDDGSFVEAKRCGSDRLPRSLRDTFSSFANTQGGVILLGVDQTEGFTVSGVLDAGKLMSDLASLAAQMVPPLRPRIDTVELEGKAVVVCEVDEVDPVDKPCHFGPSGMTNSSFTRVHDADMQLTSYEIQLLQNNRSQPRDDEEAVSGANMADLNSKLVSKFLRRIRSTREGAFNGISDTDAILRSKIAVRRPDGTLQPTLAGLLALGSYPQQFFPQLNITFVYYPTVEGDNPGTGARFLDSASLEGPIPRMVNDALRTLRRNMARRSVISGSGRSDTWEYPETALREAIANACVHRDLSAHSRGAQVQIEMYPDRLVVRSPGGLYGPVKEESLGEEGVSSSRNASLLKILEDVTIPGDSRPVCENRGSGIRSMINALRAANMSLPVFRNRISTFEVEFPNHSLLDDETVAWIAGLKAPGLSGSQCAGLALMKDGREVNNESYRKLTGVDSRVATTELQDMVGRELIEQSGSRRWATYTISPKISPSAIADSTPVRRAPADRRDAILEVIGTNELSRRQIELLTGLSAQAVRHWLKRLRSEGKIQLAGDGKLQSKNVKYRRVEGELDPLQQALDLEF